MNAMNANGVVARNRVSSRSVSRKRTSASRGRVLVVENLRERGQLVSDTLLGERFEVEQVADARDALQLLTQVFSSGQVPELIVCNARMLGDAGLELLARLGARYPEVSIIFYSAFTSPKLREQMARVEGSWILDQPFNPEHLRSVAVSVSTAQRKAI